MTDDALPDFQSAVFALAEEVGAHPDAALLHTVVHGFGRGGEEATFPPRAVYNQYAASYGHQAFGFLLVEAMSQSEGVPVVARLPPLDDEERRVLSAAHWAFAAFGARCLAPLAASKPSAAKAALSHARFDVPVEPHPPSGLFDGMAAQEVADAFAQHPAMRLAIETAAVLPTVPDFSTLIRTMETVETEISRLDPSDLDAYLVSLPTSAPSSVRAALLPFVCALVCLRASLNLVYELAYRQAVQGGPILITGADILAVGPRVETPFGTSSELDYGDDRGTARIPWHMERVLVIHEQGSPPWEGTVHEVMGTSFNFMDAETHVRIRDADRWMNPAPGLLASAREAWERHR